MYTEASIFCFNTTFFWCFLNPLVSTNKLVNVVDYHLCSTMCEQKVSIYGVPIRKWTESMHFYSCPSSPLKTPGTIFFFENPFPPRTKNKGVEETMICFIKIQSENMKMTWNVSFFIFCMIYNVVALLFCK